MVLVARRKPRLQALATELADQHGVRAEVIACDLTKPASRGRLPGQVEKLGLDIDVLINNAGFATGGPFHEAELDRELQQVRLLVETVVALTSMFSAAMVRARPRRDPQRRLHRRHAADALLGRLLRRPRPTCSRFRRRFTTSFVRMAWSVTALAPGPVKTDFWEIAGWEVAGGSSFEDAVPSPAMITPEQAAKAGIDGLASGARVVVPGLPTRVAMQAARYLPHALKLPTIERIMRRR